MASELEWTGQKEFAAAPLEEWVVGDHGAGLVRTHKGFTFATVYEAGHMVSVGIAGAWRTLTGKCASGSLR